jgi:acyl-CoA thioester hydrolase
LHRYGSAPMAAPFTHRLRVRYGECDPQGIVFNAHYLAFFDIALTELWREALPGGYRAMTEAGTDLVVAEARCRYLSSAGFDDELDIGVGIVHLGTTSMRMALDVARAGEPIVAGELRHVFVELAGRAKKPIPDEIRAALEPYVTADPTARASS